MFLVCWHYCTSFIDFLIYATGPILILLGAFVMKRGLLKYRTDLKKRALIIWLIAGAKIAFFDAHKFLEFLLCAEDGCTKGINVMINALTIALMGAVLVGLYMLYKKFEHTEKIPLSRAGNIHVLERWTKYAIVSVMVFVFWAAAPFLISLFSGEIPSIFLIFSWPYFAIISGVCLGMAFWRLEECEWQYNSTKSRMSHKRDVWVPKDTLWTLVFIYVVTTIMAFAASKVITDAATNL